MAGAASAAAAVAAEALVESASASFVNSSVRDFTSDMTTSTVGVTPTGGSEDIDAAVGGGSSDPKREGAVSESAVSEGAVSEGVLSEGAMSELTPVVTAAVEARRRSRAATRLASIRAFCSSDSAAAPPLPLVLPSLLSLLLEPLLL